MFTLRNVKPSWILQPVQIDAYPDSKVCGTNMVPVRGRQDPGGPHVGLLNLAIWVVLTSIQHLFVRCNILYSSNMSIFNYMISRIDRKCCLDKVSGAKLFHTRNRPHYDMLHLHISILLTFLKWLASHLIYDSDFVQLIPQRGYKDNTAPFQSLILWPE